MDVVCFPGRGEVSPWNKTGANEPPASPAPDRTAEATRRAENPPRVRQDANKGCVLVVDDDYFVLETLVDLLEVVGYRPIQATDAAEALMILRQEDTVDALVTDLTMPGADGIALIRHARGIRSELPAILLTGYAEEVTCVTAIAGSNFHVLRKPVESERLIEQLEVLIKRTSDA